jgi:hypothetical protein
MEQFSGGGPPNPRFLPTVQVNHKKLYYNYYTLGKYLLKIQISGKKKTKKKFPKVFLKWPKKDKF